MGASSSRQNLPVTSKFSDAGENDTVKYAMSSMQGWHDTMDDACAALLDLDNDTSTPFFGVYDGHGGDTVALFCAKHFHTEVVNDEAYLNDLPNAVRRAFFRMDGKTKGQEGWRELANHRAKSNWIQFLKTSVYSKLWSFGEEPVPSNYIGPRQEGSSVCVAVIRDNLITIGNVGDTRCVVSKNGQALELSIDHKPTLPFERARIESAGGNVTQTLNGGRIEGRISLSRAIGYMEYKQNKNLTNERQVVTCNPNTRSVHMTDDTEFLVIASDGIWDCMTCQHVVNFVRHRLFLEGETDLKVICEALFDYCLAPRQEHPGIDNMTVILVQFKRLATTASS